MNNANNTIIRCQDVGKDYHDGTALVKVLKSIDLSISAGERIAIVGPSGSGKSTLLHLLGGLDKPTAGQIFMQGVDWQKISEKKRCQLRNQYLGFIYQFHYLLPEFTALENVAMPLLLAGMSIVEARALAVGILDKVGLINRITHKPSQLSGGERQRVAIARALVHKPRCVLADEPTGNLDNTTATHVFDLMLELNQQLQTALVVVTHDQRLAASMDRVLTVVNGELTSSK
jgi:lipoprotein-releasing system ATP-binding protein